MKKNVDLESLSSQEGSAQSRGEEEKRGCPEEETGNLGERAAAEGSIGKLSKWVTISGGNVSADSGGVQLGQRGGGGVFQRRRLIIRKKEDGRSPNGNAGGEDGGTFCHP